MIGIDLLDPSLGIQGVMDAAEGDRLPRARQLASTATNAAGLDELFRAGNARTMAEAMLTPDVGDGSLLEPAEFFGRLTEAVEAMRADDDPAVRDLVRNELEPLMENRELFDLYRGLLISG